jgi:chromosome segregation ATPase
MRLFIRKMEIENWKGIRKEAFEFDGNETWFEGANGTGKTSMFDAVLWTLFGIDHLDRSDYQIRPTVNGEPVHRLESKVCVQLLIDETEPLSLKRIYKEQWTKPKTKTEEEYKGNTTDYYINDVPVQKKEYDARVASICSVNGFKAVTNARYFNSLNWDVQRKILFEIAGDVTDDQVATGNEKFEELLKEVTGVGFVAFKKALSIKKKKLQDELDDIDPRISELLRNRPEILDWDELRKTLEKKEQEVSSIEKQLGDVAQKSEQENKKRLAVQNSINDLEQENQKIKIEAENKRAEGVGSINQKIRDKWMEKGNKERDGKAKKTRLDYLRGERERLQTKKSKLLDEYRTINAETLVFKEGEFICPTCKRQLDDSDIEEKQQHMNEEFNRSKTERIEKNIREGKALKAQIDEIEKEIGEIGEIAIANVSEIENEIGKLNKELAQEQAKPLTYTETSVYKENEAKIASLRAKLVESNTSTPDEELKLRKAALGIEIKEIVGSLAKKEQIENTEKRKSELEQQKKTLNQEIANLEEKEFLIKNFEDAKSAAVENEVNKLFSIVKFKLFKKQVDGQMVPNCECMIGGVLYSTLNNAMQIAAGLDIIRVLNKHYNLYAPIYIDNRESVTEIPEMDCQIINLVVNPAHKRVVQSRRENTLLFS